MTVWADLESFVFMFTSDVIIIPNRAVYEPVRLSEWVDSITPEQHNKTSSRLTVSTETELYKPLVDCGVFLLFCPLPVSTVKCAEGMLLYINRVKCLSLT